MARYGPSDLDLHPNQQCAKDFVDKIQEDVFKYQIKTIKIDLPLNCKL